MKKQDLLTGYQDIIRGIYNGKAYYARVLQFLRQFKPVKNRKEYSSFSELVAFAKSIFILGFLDAQRKYYWYILTWSLFNKPTMFPKAVTYSIYGYHFRKVFKEVMAPV